MKSASKTITLTAAASVGGADLTRMKRPPTHPGVMFQEEVVTPRGYGARSDIARRMGITIARLAEICAGRRPVTPESAVLMAAVSGTSPQLWLHLQADYDLWHALQTTNTTKIKKLDPIEPSDPAA